MQRVFVLAAIVGIALTGHDVYAQEASETDLDASYVESIAFDEVLPNEPGEWAVRAAMVATRDRAAMDPVARTYLMPSAQLYFGIVDRLGGELELPLIARVSGDQQGAGLGNVGAGLKYLLLEQRGALPYVTAMLEVHAPTGDASMIDDNSTEIETSFGIAFARRRVVVQAAFGVATSLGTENEYALIDNLSIAVALPARLHVFGEVMLETALPTLDVNALAGPGLKLDATRELFVAASVLLGINDIAESRAVVQVQYGF